MDQVYNPLYLWMRGPTPQIWATNDLKSFIAHAFLVSWMSHDPKDPNSGNQLFKSITPNDVGLIRGLFLNLLEKIAVCLWSDAIDQEESGTVIIENDFLSLENKEGEVVKILWIGHMDEDSIFVEMMVDDKVIQKMSLKYSAFFDTQDVFDTVSQARQTIAQNNCSEEFLKYAQLG